MAFYNSINDLNNFVISFTRNPQGDFGVFAKGYTQSAYVLAEHLLGKQSFSDYEAYPVVFLYRQAFELYLKGFYYKARLISSFKDSENLGCQFIYTHKLKPLAETFQKICKVMFPSEHLLLQLANKVCKYAIEFEQIDSGSFSYRYPINKTGNPSTNHHQIVNLLALHNSMKELLDELGNVDFGFDVEVEQAREIYEIMQEAQVIFDENHPTTQMISQNYLKLQQELENLKRREVEQRIALEEAKKLSYLGYMATGVAHNINNPVGIIRLAAQRGLRGLGKGMSVAEGQEIFQRILTQAERLHTIIQNFREFANGDRKRREIVELNALVEQIKGHFESQLEAHHITLTLGLSNENPCSQANHFVLQEVLINLISNAREALKNIPQAFILIKTWQTAEKVGLQVEDNGTGVPQEQQKNLFSPFHSTKAHGTGLGLYFAHQAVADLGGTITYQDRKPSGACFIIELPPTTGEKI